MENSIFQEIRMMSNLQTRRWLYVSAVVLLLWVDFLWAQEGPSDAAMASIRPEAIRADMRFLSDDLL